MVCYLWQESVRAVVTVRPLRNGSGKQGSGCMINRDTTVNTAPRSTPTDPLPEVEAWKQSRSGAWAGRGFHYQYLVSVLLLVRPWAGLAPLGYLVPEGFDDCVIELGGERVWVQIKSRKDAGFGGAEVCRILDDTDARAASLLDGSNIRSTLILEQPRISNDEADIACLFDDKAGRVFVCRTPGEDIVRLLSSKLELAEVTADSLASDLYRMVAVAAAENASLSFDERRRISATDVERLIFERLEAADPTAIDDALVSGAVAPVDFTTPVNEPDFYRGVKVKPGHVAANLVLDRPDDVDGVLGTLWRRRHVLVSGPSGAGKSALVWLATAAAAGQMRWYRITGVATAAHAEVIVRFIRARRPTETSPLGLVLDEVGSSNSGLWDVLVGELRGLPNLYLLGSVRQEDVNLITNQSDTVFFPVDLGEDLARAVWEKLAARNDTNWIHWREPFEQSDGLMLEYVHLLTQGKRLAAVIEEQIRQREQEGRTDELKIVRSAAVLCAHGGEVDANRLFELLDLTPDAANLALKRLIDEHLVRESRPGVLGGLHALRSNALVKASHDESVFQEMDTLGRSLPATTGETLPRVVQCILAGSELGSESQSLRYFADMLGKSSDIDQWTSILTGLGLATLERHVASFLSLLDRHGVHPTHRSLASAYAADTSIEVPELTGTDQWLRLRKAVLAFRASPKHDLRTECLAHLPAGTTPPRSCEISQINRLLSSLAPICGGDSVPIAFPYDLRGDRDPDIRQIARLLSTAFLVDPKLADGLVDSLGGERVLLDLFHSQVPWTTPPIVESHGPHGRTVRSNWHYIAELHQTDPHETVCEICETLIALSPRSDAAACDAVDPSGNTVAVGDYKPWSKNIPRANLPSKARVAWNVAFRRILLARTGIDSLTDYTSQMATLVRRTERIFRSFSEKWIKGKRISNADAVVTEINRIVDDVDALTYAEPARIPSTMTDPFRAGIDDTLGSLLTGVLGNLVGRLSSLDTAKAAATFAGSLHGQVREHGQSEIWRTTSSPPLKDLARLSERLSDVSCILHEFAHDSAPDAIRRICDATRKASLGRRVHAAALNCRLRAQRRFENRLRELESALASRGWNARCLSRPIDEFDSPYWPACEVAVLVEVEDLAEQWLPNIEELLSVIANHLDNDWPFRAVPTMNGRVLASLALVPTSHIPLPDQEFAGKWADFIDQPVHSSMLLETFEQAVAACMQVSAIVNARGVQDLHPEEDDVLSRAVDTFKNGRAAVENAANQAETEHFVLALDYLDRNWSRLIEEIEAVKAGKTVKEPLCMTPHLAIAVQESEHVVDIACVRLVLLQAECNGLADSL